MSKKNLDKPFSASVQVQNTAFLHFAPECKHRFTPICTSSAKCKCNTSHLHLHSTSAKVQVQTPLKGGNRNLHWLSVGGRWQGGIKLPLAPHHTSNMMARGKRRCTNEEK